MDKIFLSFVIIVRLFVTLFLLGLVCWTDQGPLTYLRENVIVLLALIISVLLSFIGSIVLSYLSGVDKK